MPPSLSTMVLVALAYAFTGWASLLLSVSPGYTIPIFLPAGIALAALITFGNRLLPAIFIGSLLVQVGAGLNAHLHGIAWLSALIVPLGAALQALTGKALAQHLIGLPSPLDRQDSIISFLFIVTPVSSLVAPSIAVPTLLFLGGLDLREALFNWWSWWVGDTLGILVAVPLFLVFFGLPAEDWRPRRQTVAIPLLIALALTVVMYLLMSNWDRNRIEARFQRETEQKTNLIKNRLDAQMDMMLAIERWLDMSPNPSAANFRSYTTPWLNRYPGTQNFGWAPQVNQKQKTAFEQALRKQEYPDFLIQDRDGNGNLTPAAEAPFYLPLTYLEPLDTNWRALGLNILALPSTAATVRRAWQSGQPEASEPFPLVQGKNNPLGIVIYQALYTDREKTDSNGLHPLRGILSGVFRLDTIMTAILDGHAAAGLELCLVDRNAPAGRRLLFGAKDCGGETWTQAPLHKTNRIDFAGRQWEIHHRATMDYMTQHRSWAVETTIAIGLASISMLGAFLLVASGSSRRISLLVAERTRQLTRTTQKLEEQQTALKDAQHIARLGSWEWAPGEALIRCSDEMHQLLGGALPKLTLRDFPALFQEDDQVAVNAAIMAALKMPDSRILDAKPKFPAADIEVLHLQIESIWQEDKLVRLRGTLQDVTALRTAEAHVHYLAHYDILTGLPNRSHWLSRARTSLSAAQRHGEKLAVLFLDLDRFKNVNDSLGHPIGDRLLATVAQRLTTCLRSEDLLARLGGDEFVVLLERVEDPEEAGAVARKILAALAEPLRVDEHELTLTFSIGIALYPDDGQNIDTLLLQADVAMYGAKSKGRNNYQFFVPDMTFRASERLSLEAALRRALERQEFVLHFQPQIEPRSGHVSGAEALIRWQHPERGLLLPSSFITIAEDTGMIMPIGEWVLQETCKQQQRWLKAGLPPIRLAVNISGLQFLRPDFVNLVSRALADSGADPRLLELELTESTLMEPDEALINRLIELRHMGFTLALDDFGTGYSSLSYLKRLPITRLKVDRSFIRDLPGDQEDTAIAVATLSMARDLGLDVVAEGVESVDQMEFLLERGCANMQGFYFSKPLPAAEFEQFLRQHGGLETWLGGHDFDHFPDI